MIDQFNQSKVYSIQGDFSGGKSIQYEQLLKGHNLKFRLVKEIKQGDMLSANRQVHGHAKNHQQFIAAIMKDTTVARFEY